MPLGAGHFAKSFPHVIRGPYPSTSMRWVPWFSFTFAIRGSEGLPSHPQVTEHVCGPVNIGFQLCLIPSMSHGSALLGPWILLRNRERDKNRIQLWGLWALYQGAPMFFSKPWKAMENRIGWWFECTGMTCVNLRCCWGISLCSSKDTQRGRDLAWRHRFRKYFYYGEFWSFEGVNDDSPTLGEKLTIKANKAKRKPVKVGKLYQRCGWRTSTSRVGEGAERTAGHMGQWSVCKSNPVVCWWWWFWLFLKSKH